jgi:hypothetical protein
VYCQTPSELAVGMRVRVDSTIALPQSTTGVSSMSRRSRLGPPSTDRDVARTVFAPACSGAMTLRAPQAVQARVAGNPSPPWAIVPFTRISIGRSRAVPFAKRKTSVIVADEGAFTVHSTYVPVWLLRLT